MRLDMLRPRLRDLFLLLATLALPASSLAATVPEPQGYWLGADHGATPERISGGTVIHTAALNALIERKQVVVIDVVVASRRPEGMATGAPWMPPPHQIIPGAAWLPELGGGALPPARDAWLRNRLAALTGHDRDRPVVLYCHPKCWRSWNAAKRAITYGYHRVYWYPDGIEGWQSAGLPTETGVAEQPPQG
jgi:PQQ-dependent catabolism-associated CXXCW motif protein